MDLPVIGVEAIQRKAKDAFENDLPISVCQYAHGTEEREIWRNHYVALSNRSWLEAA